MDMSDKNVTELKAITYRAADAMDVVNILRLMERAHETSGNRYPPIEPSRAIDWINRTIAEGYVVAAVRDGRIIGSMGLGPYRHPWNAEQWFATNEWLYVDQKYRDKGVAVKLMTLTKGWSEEKNVPIIIGVQDILDADTKDRFIRQQGFTYCGGIFMRWPTNAQSKASEDSPQG